MLAHLIGVLVLIGSALLVVVGLGMMLFGLARGDRALARRAAVGTVSYAAAYLLAVALSSLLAPRRVLPFGSELSFCGFDCHLHVEVVSSESEEDRIGVAIRVKSDAKREDEFPQYLQFRLVGADGSVLAPAREGDRFQRPLAAGAAYVDSLSFMTDPTARPYTLRVIYPGLLDALLPGPANSRAAGKTTLAIE